MRVQMDETGESARRLRIALGQALRNARLRAGLRKQEHLADRLGTTQQTVSRWELGELVSLDDLVAVEDMLDLGRGALLVDAGYAPRDVDVLELIRSDTSITADRRDLILDIYEKGRERAAQEAD